MLNKNEFHTFRLEAEKALATLVEKYEACIKAGKIKYTDNSFKIEFEVTKKEIHGKLFEQVEFEKCCSLFGFHTNDYKKHFFMNGRRFTIVGFNVRAKKMPVLAIGEDGKKYKFGEEVRNLIE